jgi:hypothetical protein
VGNYENGKGPDRIARDYPRDCGDQKRQRQEEEGVTIGQPDQWRL